MEKITFWHTMPQGERIISTFLAMSKAQWAKRPESRSPLWAACTVKNTVYALAISATGSVSNGNGSAFDPTNN